MQIELTVNATKFEPCGHWHHEMQGTARSRVAAGTLRCLVCLRLARLSAADAEKAQARFTAPYFLNGKNTTAFHAWLFQID